MENKDALIELSINSARLHFQNSQYGKSFAYYLLTIKLSPERKQSFLTEFGDVFREWVRELQRQNRNNDVFEAYGQAMDVFPENELVYDVMASHLYRLGFADEALQYFQQALQLNPNLHSTQENVFNLSNALVERWHFRMLNDRGRNMAFQQAIRRAISTRKGPVTVLDIGAGTGILSMFAVEGGATGVYACEMSKTMTRVAEDVLLANQMADKIQLFQIKSTAMKIPEHIPNRVSIVVTETLDSELLGEGILDTVHHAWEHLLQPPNELGGGGRVIPGRATVFAMLIECQHIRKSHRLIHKSIGSVNLDDLTIVSPCVRMTAGPDVTDISSISPEPYTSEDMSSIPGGYTPLSNSFKVKDINFNNPEEIASLQGTKSQPNSLVVPIVQKGTIDAIVMWFDLKLDMQTSISTSPWSKSCWENAVYPVYPINKGHLKGDGDVCCSDCVHFDVICKDNHLAFQNIEVKSATKKTENEEFQIITKNAESNETVKALHASHTTLAKTKDLPSSIEYCSNAFSTSGSNHPHAHSEFACHKSLLEETTKSNKVLIMDEKNIQTLNDRHYQLQICEAIRKAVDETLKKRSLQGRDDDNECDLGNSCRVLDISEGVSLATLYAAHSGADRIHVCNQRDSNLDLLLHLSNHQRRQHHLRASDIQTLITKHQNDPLWWDILVVDIVEPCGLLRQNVWQDVTLARDTILNPDGIIIPKGITVYAMCIDSSWIMENSSVISNERTLDFDIKPFMNSFKVPTHPGIAFSMLQCTQLSPAIELTHIDLYDLERSPAPLKIQQEKHIVMQSDGFMTAFVYWFDVKLHPGQSINTLEPTAHFSQLVYILPEQIQVSAGDNINVLFLLEDSSISFKVSI